MNIRKHTDDMYTLKFQFEIYQKETEGNYSLFEIWSRFFKYYDESIPEDIKNQNIKTYW